MKQWEKRQKCCPCLMTGSAVAFNFDRGPIPGPSYVIIGREVRGFSELALMALTLLPEE